MKKDVHDLLYTVWLDEEIAMINRDEPEGLHHFEILHNEKSDILLWAREVAHKLRYAHTIHIMGIGDTRQLLQHEIENDKNLMDIIITNSLQRKMTKEQFQDIAKTNLVS